MGGRLKVDWQESSEELKQRYKQELHTQRRTRLQALWQLRQGKRPDSIGVVDLTGASYRSVQQWLRWYRQGGPRCNRGSEAGGRASGKG